MTEVKPCCHDYCSVCDVLERKAIKGVVLVDPHMTIRDAAALMLSAGGGSLPRALRVPPCLARA